MKREKKAPLVDEYLKSIEGITEAETNPFFYTRIKARMEKEFYKEKRLPAKLAWVVSVLLIFLLLNGYALISQIKQKSLTASENSSIQNFANDYNLSVSTPF